MSFDHGNSRLLKQAHTAPSLTTLILLTGTSLLSLNMFLPALPQMAVSFRVEYALMTVAVAGYLVAAAVMQLLFGPLSDRFGRRPVLLVAFSVFFIASLGGLLATNIWVFLTFRFLQSAVVAGGVVSQAIVRDTTSQDEAASRLGYIAMVMALAPMVGPAFGGAMADWLGWRSIYLLYTLVGGALVFLCWADLGETNSTKSASIGEQFKSYPALFSSRRFWGYSLAIMFSVGCFFIFISGAPYVVDKEFGLSTTVLGIGIGSISGGFMFGNFISGRFVKRLGVRRLIVIGRIVAVIGPLLGVAVSMAGLMTPLIYFGSVLFIGIGNGLTVPGANVGIISINPKLAGSAAGVAGAITIGGGAVTTWGTGILLQNGVASSVHLALIAASAIASLICIFYVVILEQRHDQVTGR